jgi:hypothetical protein
VVGLVGEVAGDLLAGLGLSPNVAVARAPAAASARAPAAASARAPAAASGKAGNDSGARPGWEPGALAMQEAARRRATYVIVPDDPLAEVAASWRQMWDLSAGAPAAAAAAFEASAADALAAWTDKRFELPDYYVVMAPAQAVATGPDLYLGPLRAVRPRRIAVAGVTASPAPAASFLDALRSLEHGPWWPPLAELLDAARRSYAGGLAETQQVALTRPAT